MRYLLAAILMSLFCAVAVHSFDCRVGTHAQCLVSSQLFWAYWLGFFIPIGMLAAAVAALVRMAARKRRG